MLATHVHCSPSPLDDCPMPESDPIATEPIETVFIDLEGVIVEVRPGREHPAFSMRPGAEPGLRRLAQVTESLVGLVEPPPAQGQPARRGRAIDRLVGVRAPMTRGGPEILFVGCQHGEVACSCRKPGTGLIQLARERYGLGQGGWHISADAEAVMSGRNAGLRTIRIGPPAGDPETSVHRADYEARDLLDAANWILVQSLGVPTA